MTTKAGVGYSENPNSRDAGVEAAGAALAEAGIETCGLAILYSTPKHDPSQLREGIRAAIGPGASLIGGYAVGIITRNRLGYGGCEVGVAVVSSDTVNFDMFIEGGLPDNEYNVGRALGKQITSKNYSGETAILLMYDAVKKRTSSGLALNIATPILPAPNNVSLLAPWNTPGLSDGRNRSRCSDTSDTSEFGSLPFRFTVAHAISKPPPSKGPMASPKSRSVRIKGPDRSVAKPKPV